MGTLKSANVTKYDAGGGGDNYIPDGYIRSVEKVWIDSYTMAQTSTNNTLHLAVIPENKKITSIDIIIETTASQTSGTVSVGFSTDASVDTFLPASTLTHNLTKTSISLPGVGLLSIGATAKQFQANTGGFQKVTSGTQTVVALKLNNWTASSGTIKSIVRYT